MLEAMQKATQEASFYFQWQLLPFNLDQPGSKLATFTINLDLNLEIELFRPEIRGTFGGAEF